MSNKTGENNPFYGKQHTEETRRQISEKLKEYYKTHDNSRKGAKHTEEAKKKLSEARKKHFEEHPEALDEMSKRTRKQFEEKGHPFAGKQHSEETKKKISESVKKYAKEHPPSPETREKLGRVHRGKPKPIETRRKMSEAARGEKNHEWQGGISFEPYSPEFNESNKELIRERDGWMCQLCGKTEEANGMRLAVHHIDYDKKNDVPENHITLCQSCNSKVNQDREHCIRFFQGIVRPLI